MTFLGPIRELRSQKWRERKIRKIVAEISLLRAEAAGARNWQEHINDILKNCWWLSEDYLESEKILGDVSVLVGGPLLLWVSHSGVPPGSPEDQRRTVRSVKIRGESPAVSGKRRQVTL